MRSKLKDVLRLVHVLTWSKCWNAMRVWLHFQLAKQLKWSGSPGLPISMSVEPTTACNLGCPECPSGLKSFNRPTGNLKLEHFQRWIVEWKKHLVHLNFYFQGEPFIHPQILQMVSLAKQNGIYTAISSNGHFFSDKVVDQLIDSGLDRLIISMDGFSQSVYEQYRKNGNVEEVKCGVERLLAARSKRKRGPHIILQVLVVKPNESEVEQIKHWAQTLGVDQVKLKTAQLYHPHENHPLLPTQEKYRRYEPMENGEWRIKNDLGNQCWRLWSGCVITWDGRVVPCCFDKDAKYDMGNLNESSLKEIWDHDLYRSFRKKLLLGRKEIDICSNCSEGTKVWA
jgi:radical SAM protein with 4Fe4S-binding SPASM domain